MFRMLSSDLQGKPGSATVIVDDAVVDHPLRVVPLLGLLRVTTLTYPYGWRLIGTKDCSLFPHEWILDEHTKELAQSGRALAIISSPGIEDGAPRFSISSTVEGFVQSGRQRQLWVVVDSLRFRFHGEMRPIAEEPWASHVKYNDLYTRASKWFAEQGWRFTLRDSKSIYFQLQAAAYGKVTGSGVTRLETLVHNLTEAPFLPVWEDLSRCLNFGHELPSFRASDIATFLSRYVELAPDSPILRSFCEALFSLARPLLDRAERTRLVRTRWSDAAGPLDELARLQSGFNPMKG